MNQVQLALSLEREFQEMSTEIARLQQVNDRQGAALRQIANRTDDELKNAATLHWDMRGWALDGLALPRNTGRKGEA